MTPKELANDMVRKNFEILAKASNYKSLKQSGEKMFYAIEKLAKETAVIGVNSAITVMPENKEFWFEVKTQIEKL